jgi:hypothetical protein
LNDTTAASLPKQSRLNRVSTEVGEIPKADYGMKVAHVALDAV